MYIIFSLMVGYGCCSFYGRVARSSSATYVLCSLPTSDRLTKMERKNKLESVVDTMSSVGGDGCITETDSEEVLSSIQGVENNPMVPKRVKRLQRTCVSGGASGADFAWCEAAQNAGFDVKILSFPGHFAVVPDGVITDSLETKQIIQADSALDEASRTLGRRLRTVSSYTKNLLRRDWWIIKDVDAVFAVGWIKTTSEGLGVDGGTGWSCEMFWNRNKHRQTIPLFVYDMNDSHWYQVTNDAKWKRCDTPSMVSYENVAMIGSRMLVSSGRRAIEDVFRLLEEELQ